VAAFLASQQAAAFTYAEVGATRGDRPPAGYTVDRNRIRLGTGAEAFRRAAGALCRWQMLTHDWAAVAPPSAPVAAGTTVAVVVHHYGFWSLNACRIVYVLADTAPDGTEVRRVGFAYGTLPEHGAIGEEITIWRIIRASGHQPQASSRQSGVFYRKGGDEGAEFAKKPAQ